ncbi:MAG: YfcL family protein [Colwellia sp.]
MSEKLVTLADLYQYLDSLYDAESAIEADHVKVDSIVVKIGKIEDVLFASGYIRGFISLASTEYGGEEQLLTQALIATISQGLLKAKTELTPQDFVIVQNFWLELQKLM